LAALLRGLYFDAGGGPQTRTANPPAGGAGQRRPLRPPGRAPPPLSLSGPTRNGASGLGAAPLAARPRFQSVRAAAHGQAPARHGNDRKLSLHDRLAPQPAASCLCRPDRQSASDAQRQGPERRIYLVPMSDLTARRASFNAIVQRTHDLGRQRQSPLYP